MSEAPVPTFEQVLAQWEETAKAAKRLATAEVALRNQLFAAAFPSPTEGANSRELADGRIFKGTHKINRSIDEAVVKDVIARIRLASNEVDPDLVFKVKFDLAGGPYKKLPVDIKKIADEAITAKPGTPSIEVV